MGLLLLRDFIQNNSFSFAKVSVNQITKMLEELQVSLGWTIFQLDS